MRKKLLTAFTALIAAIALLMGLAACGTAEYEIKFAAEDGTTLCTLIVEEGQAPVFTGETPTKAQTAQYTYTFAGWKDADGVVYNGELPAATANATYTAAFTQVGRTYTVKWSVNGTETSETLAYGAAAAYGGETPVKANTAQYTYAFAGWNDGEKTYGPAEALPTVSKDVTYTAEFTSTVNSYTVTWHVESQTSTSTVEYGSKAVYGETEPAKAQSESTVYTFAGWAAEEGGDVLEEEPTVTGDLDLYAVFTESARKYTVKFFDEDGATELYSAQFNYDAVPAFSGEAPAKANTVQYTYTFAGWLDAEDTLYGPADALPKVRSDMTFKAKFTSTVNKYTVTWSVNGATTAAQFEYGAVPAYEGTPSKPDTPQFSYEFDGWAATEGGEKLATLPAVEGDVTYYARFNEVTKKYTVTWHIGEETTTSRVTYNTAPAYDGDEPEKAATTEQIFSFSGWSKSESGEVVNLENEKVTGDTDYYAVFSAKAHPYTITFVIEGVSHEQVADYGTKPSYEGEVTKQSTVSTAYTFRAWKDAEEEEYANSALPTVTGDATYTAVFDEAVRQYTVTIKYYKGLTGTETIKNADTYTLGYGTILNAENTNAIAAIDDGGKHYLPNMFRIGGIVEGDKEYIVRYTEADTWDGAAKSESLQGTGEKDDPYLIQSAADLNYLSGESNNKNYAAGKYYKLTKSIDLAGYEWTPICYANGSGTWRYFEGNFDGAGYTIAGLHCDKETGQGVGLFACIRNGEIKDLTVQGDLSAKSRAGGLAYFVDAETVSNIKTFVDITLNLVTNEVYSGGVFGTTTVKETPSTFTNLENYGTIVSTGKRVGGIIGNTGSGSVLTLTDCINYGDITIATHAGGMVGQADGKVVASGCVNFGNMTANIERAGGIIATQQGAGTALTNCINYGKIHAPNAATADKADATGGIIGIAKSSTVTGCINYGEVLGIQHTGGICGETVTVTVTDCVNYGDIKGEMTANDRNKGFAGIVGWTTTSSNVTGCENHGNVEGNTNTGGICGYLGKGSTCPAEGENANENFGTVKANSAKGDLIGYDGNNA